MVKLNDTEPTCNNAAYTIWTVIGVLSILILFALVFICDFSKWVIFSWVAISGFFLYFGAEMGTKSRPTRSYVDADGNLDLTTPRQYSSKNAPALRAFLGSPWAFRWGIQQIQEFSYADGRVYVKTKNGKSIEAPLSELEVVIHDKTKGMYAVVLILKYGGDKLKITHNTIQFEDEEIEDINTILSYAGSVKESKISKIASVAAIVKDAFDDNSLPLDAGGAFASSLRSQSKKSESDQQSDKSSALASFEETLNKIEEEKYPKTEKQIATDSKIDKIIEGIEKTGLPSEEELQELVGSSSDTGRKKLFLAYEAMQGNSDSNVKRESEVMNAVYPLECAWHYIKELYEDIDTLWLFRLFLICAIISIPVCFFDNLGWWNVLIVVGIFAIGMVMFNKYVTKSENSVSETRDEIAEERNRVLNDLTSGRKPTISSSIDIKIDALQQQYKSGKTWSWLLAAAVFLTLAACLLINNVEGNGDMVSDHIEMDEVFMGSRNNEQPVLEPEKTLEEKIALEAGKAILSFYYPGKRYLDEYHEGEGGRKLYIYSRSLVDKFNQFGISEGAEPYTADFNHVLAEAYSVSDGLPLIIDCDILINGQDQLELDLIFSNVIVKDENNVIVDVILKNMETFQRKYILKRENGVFKIDDIYDEGRSLRNWMKEEIESLKKINEEKAVFEEIDSLPQVIDTLLQ